MFNMLDELKQIYGSEKQISVTKEEFINLIKEDIKSKALLVDLNKNN